MVRPLDIQTPQQIRVNSVLGVRVAGPRRPIDRLKAHRAHQPPGPAPADPRALAAQVKCHPTGAVERMLLEQLVDPPHQRERLGALLRRLVVERGTPERQQAALTAQAQRRAVRRVRRNGCIKWGGEEVFVSEALAGETVGVAETENGAWIVRFAGIDLGLFDHQSRKLLRFRAARPGRPEQKRTANTVTHVTGP